MRQNGIESPSLKTSKKHMDVALRDVFSEYGSDGLMVQIDNF